MRRGVGIHMKGITLHGFCFLSSRQEQQNNNKNEVVCVWVVLLVQQGQRKEYYFVLCLCFFLLSTELTWVSYIGRLYACKEVGSMVFSSSSQGSNKKE